MPPRTDDLFETNDAPLVSENRVAEHKRSEKSASEKQGKPSRETTASAQNSATKKKQRRMMRDVRILNWKSC
jgi:hypothetical protein